MAPIPRPEEENFTVVQNMEILGPLDTEVVMEAGWCRTAFPIGISPTPLPQVPPWSQVMLGGLTSHSNC